MDTNYICARCMQPTEREDQHTDPFQCVTVLKQALVRKDSQITRLANELVKAGEFNMRIAKLSKRIADGNLKQATIINSLLWVISRLQARLAKLNARRARWRNLLGCSLDELQFWKSKYFKEKTALEDACKELQARPKYIDVVQTSSPGDGECRIDTSYAAVYTEEERD